MDILKINLNNLRESLSELEKTIITLKNNGTLIYPTDTIYGLGCSATNEKAISRIFEIKKRTPVKALPVLVSNINMARKIAYIDKKKEEMLRKIWPTSTKTSTWEGPGPITVILQKKDLIPDILTGGQNTIGMRIPNSKFNRILIESLEQPIVATSANISGEEPDLDVRDIINRFTQEKEQPDLILDAGILSQSEPSTILDLSGLKPKIVRVGLVKKSQLLDILSF